MKPKAKRILLWALLLSLVLVCGITIAYMYRATEGVTNQLVPGVVDCTVAEVFDGTNKTSITVENTGNIAAYLRVRLVSYWVNGEGEILPIASEMPAVSPASGWITGSDNTYYYATEVNPTASTPNLLSAPLMLRQENGALQVVEVFADAIQSLPESAAEEAWKVTVTDGAITAAP